MARSKFFSQINENRCLYPQRWLWLIGQYERMQKKCKMFETLEKNLKEILKPWHMGTHLSYQRELSNEYQHDRVLRPCALDESSVSIRRVMLMKCSLLNFLS